MINYCQECLNLNIHRLEQMKEEVKTKKTIFMCYHQWLKEKIKKLNLELVSLR